MTSHHLGKEKVTPQGASGVIDESIDRIRSTPSVFSKYGSSRVASDDVVEPFLLWSLWSSSSVSTVCNVFLNVCK